MSRMIRGSGENVGSPFLIARPSIRPKFSRCIVSISLLHASERRAFVDMWPVPIPVVVIIMINDKVGSIGQSKFAAPIDGNIGKGQLDGCRAKRVLTESILASY